MNTKMREMAKGLKDQLERSSHSDGQLERMQDRIDNLESAVAHCMAFIANHFRLTDGEINNEDGLTDF